MFEARIGLAAIEARHKRELVGHYIVIGAVGKFRRRPGAAVALVEIAELRIELEVLHEPAVEFPLRPVFAFAGAQAIARAQPLPWVSDKN